MDANGDRATVATLTTRPMCGNNPVQNGGSSVYWQDSASGEMAYWPVSLSSNASSAMVGSGANYLQDDGDNILLPADYGWSIAAVGCMYGRPSNQGTSVLRDIVLTSAGGETAVWVMGGNYYSVDRSAPGNGAGFTTAGGNNTSQAYALCGIGQYLVTSTYAAANTTDPIPGGLRRPTWFANLYWCLPGAQSAFSWKLDRNINLIDFRADPTAPTGTGYLVDPYAITGSSAVY